MNYNSLKSLLFKLDAEMAHLLAEYSLRSISAISPAFLNILAHSYMVNDESLEQNLLGLDFYNPVGLAGGFDKNATMIKPLSSLGFGFLEFGTFTPKAQSGNEKPRLFRLIKDESLQNAMGFNNKGAHFIAQRLKKLYPFVLPLGANIGKNKLTPNEEALNDYFSLLKSFDNLSDYFVINISSPNTKNLRQLQSSSFLKELLSEAKNISKKPILIKIAPDMDYKDAILLCQSGTEFGASGFIIANTSVDYTLLDNNRTFGGISGKLIQEKSGIFFKNVAKELFNKTLLIASGGIDSAEVAYERIKNGASLIQIFTGLVFKGPSLVKDINLGFIECLKKDGFSNIKEAIGVNLK
ncbi:MULTISPECIES: quinone-dependent dihydroorotate dehydrogenase [unclassified Campylobacter]|uniref:quinone-dependent dihydroorotate dehydrogenase n=1 Tax=unclassified Campylobacter TaxID=2593542 RepID=UPI001237B659|nr:MULTISPECIES: quinone-dependent dihydroorotate dehydrogenase [unclassified Campylobacter]KAA6225358.1 quinone-dependent dihydroorotate dehydrogenase [Campylobacter sp. LR185c]KAA6227054.1 quinone-dependent dihydroorotate dehydrogenase [Campylobacter sp. LR196d]KAA6227625.1 quinone-dependent dihydroorotate dehydrogenase [Campylobacter sp. LR286c]KAA6229490.1 quinone-dependent dihydroorotate dehydrogenase [Campylobacter sp. LR264d]KAA8604951.1 dihydroorotate dehydrogenase (quinone) [Campyloba